MCCTCHLISDVQLFKEIIVKYITKSRIKSIERTSNLAVSFVITFRTSSFRFEES